MPVLPAVGTRVSPPSSSSCTVGSAIRRASPFEPPIGRPHRLGRRGLDGSGGQLRKAPRWCQGILAARHTRGAGEGARSRPVRAHPSVGHRTDRSRRGAIFGVTRRLRRLPSRRNAAQPQPHISRSDRTRARPNALATHQLVRWGASVTTSVRAFVFRQAEIRRFMPELRISHSESHRKSRRGWREFCRTWPLYKEECMH
jgi:hypothetical protein